MEELASNSSIEEDLKTSGVQQRKEMQIVRKKQL